MNRLRGALLATAALSLAACTGLQGGEPHDDDSGKPIVVPSDESCEAVVGYVTDECGLSFGDPT